MDFLKKAVKIYYDKFDYSKVVYTGYRGRIIIFCKDHNKEFNTTPSDHLNGKGCDECPKFIIERNNTSQAQRKQNFIDKATKIYHGKYTYNRVVYTTTYDDVTITCDLHGDFEQPPKNHLDGYGCKKCGQINQRQKLALTTEEFIEKARKVHGDTYDYSKVVYTNIDSPVIIICKKHNKFLQIPHNHLNNNGCPDCANTNYSKKAIRWLNYLI